MATKFYTQEDIEKDGFQRIVFKYTDDNNTVVNENEIDVWFKDSLTGRKLFIKCGSCKRFYDAGIVSKNETYITGSPCPFCGVWYKHLQIKK